jgi:hypothetical protein
VGRGRAGRRASPGPAGDGQNGGSLIRFRRCRCAVSMQRPLSGTSSAHEDEVKRRLTALETELHDLQNRVAAVEQEQPDASKEVAALRVQIMNLDSRMGQPYPYEPPAGTGLEREQTG